MTSLEESQAFQISTNKPHSSRLANSLRDLKSGVIQTFKRESKLHWFLLLLNFTVMTVGIIAGSLLTRYYFKEGGSRKWLATWLQSCGWPVLVIIAIMFYWKKNLKPAPLTRGLVGGIVLLGCLTALGNFTYTWGVSYLPASTSTLLILTQLIFNAIFALLITRQKISSFGWNAIFLITCSSVLLALNSDSDKLPGVTTKQVVLGYITSIFSAAIYGLIYPVTEVVFRRFLSNSSEIVILELQIYTSLVATAIATIGMVANNDFRVIPRESRSFTSGTATYWLTLVWTAVAWQMTLVGAVGIVYLSSSMLAGVVLAVNIPFTSIFAVIFFHDDFGGFKVMAVLLALWGFVSYTYGGYLDMLAQSDVESAEPHRQV